MITSSLATRQSRCKKKSVKYLRPSVLILIDVMHDVEGQKVNSVLEQTVS